MPGSEPPADIEAAEQTIREHIRAFILQVPLIGHVHAEPQYPSTKTEAKAITLVSHPVLGEEFLVTNYVEIGLPDPIQETASVGGGSDEEYTGLYLTYPITFNLGIIPKIEKAGFPYRSSARMAIGIYLKARKIFKADRSLGFSKHVTHYYLQLVGQDELKNDEGEAVEHQQDWELEVRLVGKY
jgi:hypothetical protein